MYRAVGLFLVLGLLFALGCSGNPMAPSQDQIGPKLTGVVGDYKFTGKDGSIDTGKLYSDGKGNITLLPDRASSVYQNYLFKVEVEYVNPRFYSGAGYPVYYLGDTFTYKLHIDYSSWLPLNWYPILFAEVSAEQRYYPSMIPLPGDYQQVWSPVNIPAYAQDFVLADTYYIPPGATPGNDCTTIGINMEVFCGWFEFNLACGLAGYWDP